MNSIITNPPLTAYSPLTISNSSTLIYKKMVDIMRDVGAIEKSQKNAQQGFKFRGIDDMLNAFYPVLTKHGVFITTEVLDEKHEIREVERSSGKKGADKHVTVKVKYTFNAEDGSSVSSVMVGEGLDSGDKATNKSLSAAMKYMLIQSFSIPTDDMEDSDRESPTINTSDAKQSTVNVSESKPRTTFRKSTAAATPPASGVDF